MPRKSGLGKGLNALFTENNADAGEVVTLRISQIEPNRDQPRKVFDDEKLNELATSISEHGVLQPILVRPLSNGSYQLVAGERRWRASRLAELKEIPVVIKNLSDQDAMEISLIENLQREDLNPIEEALGYKNLMETLDLTQEEVADRMGKSRPVIANSLRLLNLPDKVKKLVEQGKITSSGARTLLAVPKERLDDAVTMMLGGATVKQINTLTKPKATGKKPGKNAKNTKNQFYKEAELSLGEALGRRVTITQKNKGGTLEIEFFNADDLKKLLKKF